MKTTEMEMKLSERECKPIAPEETPFSRILIEELLPSVPGWEYREGEISRVFRFKNHYETVLFVNAVAWISHREDHHPDIHLGYNNCMVSYSTHSIGGISENDFICAAKVNEML